MEFIMILSLENITKIYNGNTVLDNIADKSVFGNISYALC